MYCEKPAGLFDGACSLSSILQDYFPSFSSSIHFQTQDSQKPRRGSLISSFGDSWRDTFQRTTRKARVCRPLAGYIRPFAPRKYEGNKSTRYCMQQLVTFLGFRGLKTMRKEKFKGMNDLSMVKSPYSETLRKKKNRCLNFSRSDSPASPTLLLNCFLSKRASETSLIPIETSEEIRFTTLGLALCHHSLHLSSFSLSQISQCINQFDRSKEMPFLPNSLAPPPFFFSG